MHRLKRISLLDEKGRKSLSRHLLVAYSGESHVAANTNRQWVQDFLSGKTRTGWIEANQNARAFGQALKSRQWENAASFLRQEAAIRKKITPEAFNALTDRMVSAAERCHCGARFTGAGAGGCLWALGSKEKISGVKENWTELLETIHGAKLLETEIDSAGVRQEF